MNKSSKDIIDLISSVVVQMTPTVIITSIEAVSTNWKINTCNTFWLTLQTKVTIDAVVYRIVDYSHDSYITVSGSVEPTATQFQILAPDFFHGAYRKVNNSRKLKNDLRNPFVYLPIPKVQQDNNIESDYSYHANIRPIFLIPYDEARDTIDQQQEEAIKPMEAMASLFIDLINADLARFENPTDIEETYHPNFGEPTVWGNDSLIFNQDLSGVQQTFILDVYDGVDCSCPDVPVITCAPVTLTLDGDSITSTPSGENKAITLYDASGNPLNKTIQVDTPNALGVLILTPRIYIRPQPTGQVISYADYDDAWRVANGIDTYVPPIIGTPMLRDKVSSWLLVDGVTNEFGNRYISTGSTGGYYNPTTLTYHNNAGAEISESGAFPSQYVINHVTGIGGHRGNIVLQASWGASLIACEAFTTADFSDWFIGNANEMISNANWAKLNYNGNADTVNYNVPWNTGIGNAKWSSTTYRQTTSEAWYSQNYAAIFKFRKSLSSFTYAPFRFHY